MELLHRDCGSKLKVLIEEEGMVVFDTLASESAVTGLTYVNNAFVVVSTLKRGADSGIDSLLSDLLIHREWLEPLRQIVGRKRRTFRFVLSDKNRLVSGNGAVLSQVIRMVERTTSLSYRARGGDTEFWVLRRRSGVAFLCMRLTRRLATERSLERGGLRPEITEILCQMSEPARADIVMDPFAGSGSIVLARRQQPYNMIFGFDRSEENVIKLKHRLRLASASSRSRGGPVIVRKEDALTLPSIKDGFVDKVISDPPWGLFDQTIGDIHDFYVKAIQQMIRVTKRGGLIVLLIGRTENLEEFPAEARKELKLERRLDILLSGQKAMVVKWRRQQSI
jgi:SAM-dependent methyltransferase